MTMTFILYTLTHFVKENKYVKCSVCFFPLRSTAEWQGSILYFTSGLQDVVCTFIVPVLFFNNFLKKLTFTLFCHSLFSSASWYHQLTIVFCTICGHKPADFYPAAFVADMSTVLYSVHDTSCEFVVMYTPIWLNVTYGKTC